MKNKNIDEIEKIIEKYSKYIEDGNFILVDIDKQKLYLVRNFEILKIYDVSTSLPGEELNSFRTPRGAHKIFKKIGEGMDENTVFVGRVPYKIEEAKEKFGDLDFITCRILWLEGLEEGKNKGKREGILVDTKERYIYIHGTLREDEIGKPVSKGCIRMRNKDIAELFNIVNEGEIVIIEEKV